MNYILKTKDEDGEIRTREFWCSGGGGYVRQIDDRHPGTMGQQVNERLEYFGNMLYCSNPDSLPRMIRAARRRELSMIKRQWREISGMIDRR